METEIESLLRASQSLPSTKGAFCAKQTPTYCIANDPHTTFTPLVEAGEQVSKRTNIEEMYSKVRMAVDDGEKVESKAELSREAFWREMDQSEDSFQTIARFFGKGVIQ
jgi:hypothetical protein